MATIKDYINSNYCIAWQHPEATVDDWNTFLLQESHYDKTVRRVNGLFISLFATPGSVYYAESNKFLQKSQRPQTVLRDHYIQTPNISPTNVIGWDNCDYYLKEPWDLAYNNAREILEEYLLEGLPDILKLNNLLKIDWITSFKLTATKIIEQLPSEDQAEFDLSDLIRKAFDTVAEDIDDFVSNQLLPILNQWRHDCDLFEKMRESLEHLNNLIHNFNGTDFKTILSDHPFNPQEYQNCIERIKNSYINLETLIHEKVIELYRKGTTSEDFPERTQCMIATLDKIPDHLQIPGAFAFLIAGGHHLEENPHMPEERRKLCSLEPLKQFLNPHKNIVILKSKSLEHIELNK